MNKLEKLRTEVEKLEEHYSYWVLCGQAIDWRNNNEKVIYISTYEW